MEGQGMGFHGSALIPGSPQSWWWRTPWVGGWQVVVEGGGGSGCGLLWWCGGGSRRVTNCCGYEGCSRGLVVTTAAGAPTVVGGDVEAKGEM